MSEIICSDSTANLIGAMPRSETPLNVDCHIVHTERRRFLLLPILVDEAAEDRLDDTPSGS